MLLYPKNQTLVSLHLMTQLMVICFCCSQFSSTFSLCFRSLSAFENPILQCCRSLPRKPQSGYLDILLHFLVHCGLGQTLVWVQDTCFQVSCVTEGILKSLKTYSAILFDATLNISSGTLNESVLSFLCRVLFNQRDSGLIQQPGLFFQP